MELFIFLIGGAILFGKLGKSIFQGGYDAVSGTKNRDSSTRNKVTEIHHHYHTNNHLHVQKDDLEGILNEKKS
jgi:hypothetical protein